VGEIRRRVVWIVSGVWEGWKQVSRSFSSDELRACVRIVERDCGVGMKVVEGWDGFSCWG